MYLHRPSWVRANHLSTGVGLFRSTVYRWGMAPTTVGECGVEEKTAHYIITSLPIFHHPSREFRLESDDEKTVAWLVGTQPAPTYEKSFQK